MSFTIYFIICTIIAGIYFATIIAMDVTGKGQKKKESFEEFNTENMGDEGSVVVQETSPDGEYNIVNDDNDPSDIDLRDQSSEGSEHVNENSEENHEEDASAITEQQQNDNRDAAREYLKRVIDDISTKCEAVDYNYQEFVVSGMYDSVVRERSEQHNIKIINEIDKI